jgi:hypothetical protein
MPRHKKANLSVGPYVSFFISLETQPSIRARIHQTRLFPGTEMQSPPYEEFGASLKKCVSISPLT